MPVPTLVTDLSTTLASNSPAGSDNVFPDLDNYLRALSGFVASIRDNSGNGWVSPYLPLAGGTVSGNVTLNGGTANGVAYLNASKVLTTGSALTYNGTTTLTLNSGTAGYIIGPSNEMLIGADGSGLYVGNGAGGVPAIPILFGSSGTTFQRWFAGGSEQMRLTSTGLGIGTSSPANKLHVTVSAASTAAAAIYNTDAANGNGLYIKAGGSNSGKYALAIDNAASSSLLYLDSSGNLGLGVTPSAWSSGKAFEIGSGGNGIWSGSGYTSLLQNTAFTSGAYRYVTSQTAARFDIENNVFKWFTAPSGTAGNAITFTQAMTLDASGRLLVGTTSAAGNAGLQVKGASSGYARIEGTSSTLFAGDAPQLITGGAATESALRAEGALLFAAGGATERARITSGGAFYINTISSVGGANTQMVVKGVATNTQQVCAFWNPSATNTQYFLSFGTDTTYTERGYITWNGTTTAIANASDQRLKTNIVDAPSALAKVDAIKIRSFDFIADNRHIDYGVIAQELENVVPAAVFKGADNEDGSIDKPWSVGLEPLIPVLVKALQEQQALIQQLTARVAALEAQP